MELKDLVAKNVRRIREEKGLSQRELASLAKIDPRYINRLENHPQNIRLDHVQIIARALEVAPYTLLQDPRSASDSKLKFVKKLESLTDELKKTIRQVKIEIES